LASSTIVQSENKNFKDIPSQALALASGTQGAKPKDTHDIVPAFADTARRHGEEGSGFGDAVVANII